MVTRGRRGSLLNEESVLYVCLEIDFPGFRFAPCGAFLTMRLTDDRLDGRTGWAR